MSHKKFGPDRFSRFDVYWIQTDRQTDRQAKFIYRYKYINRFTFLGETPEVIPQPPQYSDLGIKYLD